MAVKKPFVIGVSGDPGSFSEEAARDYAKHAKLKDPLFAYLVTVDAVLRALEDGSVSYGIFPVANSIGGIVLEFVHAAAKHNFSVKKIFAIEIHQNLLVRKGTTAESIMSIMSHDQALKQCKGYLSRVWPKTKTVDYPDTAKAAKDLAGGVLATTTAVIASRAAAKLYNLEILEASIQDLKTNYTTFVAATRLI